MTKKTIVVDKKQVDGKTILVMHDFWIQRRDILRNVETGRLHQVTWRDNCEIVVTFPEEISIGNRLEVVQVF